MERREEETEDEERIVQSKEDVISIGKLFELIPLDLIHDILLNILPAKSAAKFRCVSKLWSSITTRPEFIRSFAIQSSARPCLLVCVKTRDKRYFISLPQNEHPDTSYSSVDRFQIDTPGYDYSCNEPYSDSVHGLICVADFCAEAVVWNPTMRQHVTLPNPAQVLGIECDEKIDHSMLKSYFLGYDPVEDKYKVLCTPSRGHDPYPRVPLVFTLGPKESWRVTENSPKHFPPQWPAGHPSICINGYVYYEAKIKVEVDGTFAYEEIMMRFDVRYEKFKIIRKPAEPTVYNSFMLNYEGKLAWVSNDSWSCLSPVKFWVLEDEEKQEWSTRNFLLPMCDPIWEDVILRLGGVTEDTGEFIFAQIGLCTIYVLYYDPKRNRTRRVEYEGIAGNKELWEANDLKSFSDRVIDVYPNHSECLMSLDNVPRYVSDDYC